MEAPSFFAEGGSNLEALNDGSAFKMVTLANGGRVVELVAFVNLGSRKCHRRLLSDLVGAAKLRVEGKLTAVIYSSPFRMRGWTFYECLYWLLIGLFQLSVNAVDVFRRIQYVSPKVVPKEILCIDPVPYMRDKHPAAFQRLARYAVFELFPYLPLPFMPGAWKAHQQDAEGFLAGISCVSDDGIRTAVLESHLGHLFASMYDKDVARVRMLMPAESAMNVRDYLMLREGFVPVTNQDDESS